MKTPLSPARIGWIAGLLEGEGSFMLSKSAPCISVSMTDHDVMQELAAHLGGPLWGPRQPKGKPTYKPVWQCRIYGSAAVGWMMTIYQFLGERRKTKVRQVLDAWRGSDRAQRAGRNWPRRMATCHPDRIVAGKGLCDQCYMAAHRQARGYMTSQQARELAKQPGYKSRRVKAMATCHPDRFAQAKGLCTSCYMKAWAARRKEPDPSPSSSSSTTSSLPFPA